MRGAEVTYPVGQVRQISARDLPPGWTRFIRYSTEPYFAALVVCDQAGFERSVKPLGHYWGETFGSLELADLIALAQAATTQARKEDRHA